MTPPDELIEIIGEIATALMPGMTDEQLRQSAQKAVEADDSKLMQTIRRLEEAKAATDKA